MVNYPLLILSLKKKGRDYILGVKLSRGCMAADSQSQQFEMYNHVLKIQHYLVYLLIKVSRIKFWCCYLYAEEFAIRKF